MRLPRPVFKGVCDSLPELARANRQEEEARRRLLDDMTIEELFCNLSSRDALSKPLVRSVLPVHDCGETALLSGRLVREGASAYGQLYLRWQREAIGYLTSICAEAVSRLGHPFYKVPDGLDFVGLEAEGEPARRLVIKAKKLGDFAGVKARHLEFAADSMGDYCLRQAEDCTAEVRTVGQCLGEEGFRLTLRARDSGDWLLLRSRECVADSRRVGRLAGLDSEGLELRVHRAGAELGERARDAVIYLRRDAKSLGKRGSGVIFVRRGSPAWSTSFHIERTL
jgi:hypothetical protein